MVYETALASLLFSYMVALLGVAAMLYAAPRFNWLAVPNQRSAHVLATPTMGGVGIVLAVLVYMLWLWVAGFSASGVLCVAMLFVAVVGLLDDAQELSARLRICVQAIAIALMIWVLDPQLPVWFLAVVALAWLWHINLFNFMDGIDGIAALHALFYCLSVQFLGGGLTGWSGNITWVVAGACLAFLTFNWPPARIFMGDVGSGFLGLLLGLIVFWLGYKGEVPFTVSIVLMSGFLFDATYTLCVRIVTGQSFTQAHKSHLYQRLADSRGHLWTTLAYFIFCVCVVFPSAWLTMAYPKWWLICLLVTVLPLLLVSVRLRVGRIEA